jgi:hypothetical protein
MVWDGSAAGGPMKSLFLFHPGLLLIFEEKIRKIRI